MSETLLNSEQIKQELKNIIGDVLGTDASGIDDDLPLLDFVTSSLALVDGMRRVYDRFGVLISIRRIMEGEAHLGALALYIEQALRADRRASRESASTADLPDQPDGKLERRRVPVALSQQHVSFLTRYSRGAASAYNESLVLQLQGPLFGPALQAAVELAGERHDATRTALSPDDDALEIISGKRVELAVSVVNPVLVETRLRAIVDTPFEAGSPLFRAVLLRQSESEHVLALVGHALVLDQAALAVILNDISVLYGILARGEDTASPSDAVQWSTYLASQHREDDEVAKVDETNFWRRQFAGGVPVLELPLTGPRPSLKSYEGARYKLRFDPLLERRFADWATRRGYRPFHAWMSAFAICLHRLSGQPEIVVGTDIDAANMSAPQPVVANTQKMMPIRSEFRANWTLAEHMEQIEQRVSQAARHSRLSLSELIQVLGVPRDQSRSALFSAAFGHRCSMLAPSFDSLETSFKTVPNARARYDIELNLVSDEEGSYLLCDYSSQLFDEETIARWISGMLALVSAALEDDAGHCGTLPIISGQERQLVLRRWNGTAKPYPSHRTVLELVQEEIVKRQDETAIRSGETRLSYADLGAKVETIAQGLASRGVGPTDRVGVLLPRTADMVASVLAIWRVGAVYVPLDHAFPRGRLTAMLADSGAGEVITTSGLLPLIGESEHTSPLLIEEMGAGAAGDDFEMTASTILDTAYIMYTSGSTGRPKGVEIAHASLSNLVLATQDQLQFRQTDCFLAITTISFDISIIELFLPLAAGGVLDLAPEDLVADGLAFVRHVERHRPTFVQATPSTWKLILSAGWVGDPEITLISTGESLERDLAEQLVDRGRSAWNYYGPTETTVFAISHRLSSDPGQPTRIGRPLPNMRAYILDEMMQPVPVGVVGELYIGGAGLGKGYWNQPELTAERFVQSPFDARQRLYRTGDLARYFSNGEIECLGRIDFQVKIHGVRVELGEIEAALRETEGLRDSVAASWKDPQGNVQLVAYLRASENRKPALADIRAHLRKRLPEVMIPPHMLFLEAFPLAPNGKIDRAALPSPVTSQGAGKIASAKPETPTERVLAQAWSEVLDIPVDRIGRDDEFMNLGGHSLLMTPLMLKVRKLFHVRFRMREFFGAPTVKSFAKLIDERRRQRTAGTFGANGSITLRNSEWGRERMAFLRRETELPPSIAPARGVYYRPPDTIKAAFLTGATGFIGTYIVSEILQTTDVELHCLVRRTRGKEGKSRLEDQMKRYAVWREQEHWQSAWRERVHVVDGDVTLHRLGMADDQYETLAREVDCIIHSAAHVNFIYPYEALRATNVLGIHEIMRFAFYARIKQIHHLSTAAIWPMGAGNTFYESDPIDHGQLLNLGYDEAKWVGEGCLLNATDRGLPVARYRPGEVGGDSRTGRSVLDHFVIAAAKGFIQLGAFPSLDMFLDITPADYVAKAFVYLALHRNPMGRAFHLTNPQRCHMSEALTFLRSLGYRFEELQFEELRSRLVAAGDFTSNALFPYQAILEDMDDRSLQLPTYDCSETLRELDGSGIVCPAVDEKLLGTYISYLREVEFLPEPTGMAVA